MSDTDDESDSECMRDYYANGDEEEMDCQDRPEVLNPDDDPEYYEVKCLEPGAAALVLNKTVDDLSALINVNEAKAKYLLRKYNWSITRVLSSFPTSETAKTDARLTPSQRRSSIENNNNNLCQICLLENEDTMVAGCGHEYCADCWSRHVVAKLSEGLANITCMAVKCDVPLTDDFVKKLGLPATLWQQYARVAFQENVNTNSTMRFCPGPDCEMIMVAKEAMAKRVTCDRCRTSFCFSCGGLYHAPTDCATIRNWLIKCRDDSETAHYMRANTKDCPRCTIPIEKFGGCNHMFCSKCKHDFCWMCLQDWRSHGSEYYECSRFKENQQIASNTLKAKEALKKYIHYYERWENHAQSLKLEKETLKKIKSRINEKVSAGSGTWIDWQYLLDGAALLAKCRYTLQYTYPYAYFMADDCNKRLFEYQQAQLEAEIENLSWKIERAETTDRGDLQNQMYIAEHRRKVLLKDFFEGKTNDPANTKMTDTKI